MVLEHIRDELVWWAQWSEKKGKKWDTLTNIVRKRLLIYLGQFGLRLCIHLCLSVQTGDPDSCSRTWISLNLPREILVIRTYNGHQAIPDNFTRYLVYKFWLWILYSDSGAGTLISLHLPQRQTWRGTFSHGGGMRSTECHLVSHVTVDGYEMTLSRVDNHFSLYPIRWSKAFLTQEEKQLDLNLSCCLWQIW